MYDTPRHGAGADSQQDDRVAEKIPFEHPDLKVVGSLEDLVGGGTRSANESGRPGT